MTPYFDWLEYFELARCLNDCNLTSSTRDARCRAAISRAYYAVFMTVRKKLERQYDKNYNTTTVHQDVRSDLENDQSDDAQDLASALATMWTARKEADYESRLHSDAGALATQQIASANKAICYISALWPDQPKEQGGTVTNQE